jgi:hypothetical protein
MASADTIDGDNIAIYSREEQSMVRLIVGALHKLAKKDGRFLICSLII